ncbi:MAG: translation initiation factor [Bacteroidota bacterium]|jgi:translation initiation factor 1|nr:translation initiation factor [Sphingobacteriia bacterium]
MPKPEKNRIVYSTKPDLVKDQDALDAVEITFTGTQNLRIHLDRLGGGKCVSRITGFKGNTAAFEELTKFLKSSCGVGGNFKNDEILIQGDKRDKLMELLFKKGYLVKKSGG